MSNETQSKGKIRIEAESAKACAHCGEPMGENAASCPHCGGNNSAAVAVGLGAIIAFISLLLAILYGWVLLLGVIGGIGWAYAGWRVYR